MERHEHIDWCKKRAIEYLNIGDTQSAFLSFQSDMTKHQETQNHLALELGTMLMLSGNLSTPTEMKNWIEGFN